MNYKSGKKVLPKSLMEEVQKYIQGECLYIPKAEGTKRKWGDKSGYRRTLSLRNDEIREAFVEGRSIEELSGEYYLAVNTIKKIVYTNKSVE